MLNELIDGIPRELPPGTKELNRTGSPLKSFFIKPRSSQLPHARKQAREVGDKHD